jgi:hypothetical protein
VICIPCFHLDRVCIFVQKSRGILKLKLSLKVGTLPSLSYGDEVRGGPGRQGGSCWWWVAGCGLYGSAEPSSCVVRFECPRIRGRGEYVLAFPFEVAIWGDRNVADAVTIDWSVVGCKHCGATLVTAWVTNLEANKFKARQCSKGVRYYWTAAGTRTGARRLARFNGVRLIIRGVCNSELNFLKQVQPIIATHLIVAWVCIYLSNSLLWLELLNEVFVLVAVIVAAYTRRATASWDSGKRVDLNGVKVGVNSFLERDLRDVVGCDYDHAILTACTVWILPRRDRLGLLEA